MAGKVELAVGHDVHALIAWRHVDGADGYGLAHIDSRLGRTQLAPGRGRRPDRDRYAVQQSAGDAAGPQLHSAAAALAAVNGQPRFRRRLHEPRAGAPAASPQYRSRVGGEAEPGCNARRLPLSRHRRRPAHVDRRHGGSQPAARRWRGRPGVSGRGSGRPRVGGGGPRRPRVSGRGSRRPGVSGGGPRRPGVSGGGPRRPGVSGRGPWRPSGRRRRVGTLPGEGRRVERAVRVRLRRPRLGRRSRSRRRRGRRVGDGDTYPLLELQVVFPLTAGPRRRLTKNTNGHPGCHDQHDDSSNKQPAAKGLHYRVPPPSNHIGAPRRLTRNYCRPLSPAACPGPAPELSHPSVPYPTGLAGEKKPSHGTHCPIDSATLHSPLSIRVHDGELE